MYHRVEISSGNKNRIFSYSKRDKHFSNFHSRFPENPRTDETTTTHCWPYKGQNACLNLLVQIFCSESSRYEKSKFSRLFLTTMTEFAGVWSPVMVIILAFWNLFSRQTQIQSWLHTSSRLVFSLPAVPQQQSWGLCNLNLVFLEELAYFYRESPGPDLGGYVGHQNMWQRRATPLIWKENTTIRAELDTIVRRILCDLILFYLLSKIRQRCSQ